MLEIARSSLAKSKVRLLADSVTVRKPGLGTENHACRCLSCLRYKGMK